MRTGKVPTRRWVRHSLQRGSAMLEFVVVGPLITVLGLGILQYSLMFFAKNQIDHAVFIAARAGSVAHANVDSIRNAYLRALIPLYGGGINTQDLATSHLKAVTDLTPQFLRIEVLNPTRQSFDDFATNQALNDAYGVRAIPNSGLALRQDLQAVGTTSGQTVQDANLLKLRITHGYTPKVWLLGMILNKYQQWLDSGRDTFATQLIASGRVPLVSHVTLEMQSDALEQIDSQGINMFASSPGMGNSGKPVGPSPAAPDTQTPAQSAPECLTVGCTVTYLPGDPGSGSNSENNGGNDAGSNLCSGANCPTCNG